MGGEPTFVSIDDMDGAEWNTRADAPHKRQLANTLVRRLRESFGPGGMLHFGQGKWYPGEPLPRWSYACFWRKDGAPVWRDARITSYNVCYTKLLRAEPGGKRHHEGRQLGLICR